MGNGAALVGLSVDRSYGVQSVDRSKDQRWPIVAAVALMIGVSGTLWAVIITAVATLL